MHSSRRPSLVSLDSDSQVDSDDVDSDSDEEDTSLDDDDRRSLSSESLHAGHCEELCDDPSPDCISATQLQSHRMLHALNKVGCT